MRIKVELDEEDVALAYTIGMQRQDKKKNWKSTAKPKRNSDLIHVHGMMGEIAAAKLFGAELDLSYKVHGDDGWDFELGGKKYDVKTINYDPPILKLNHIKDFLADYIVVCLRVSDSEICVCGIVDKRTFLQHYYKKEFGYGSRYCVNEKHLLPPTCCIVG